VKPDPRILLVKLGAVGDLAHTLPALHSLRRSFPGAYIAWIAEAKSIDLIAEHSELDEVILFDRKRFSYLGRRPWFWGKLIIESIRFARQLRQRKFDIAIDCQTLFKSGLITFLSGAPLRIGFDRWRELNRLFTNKRIPADGSNIHATNQYLALVESAGAEKQCDWVAPSFNDEIRKRIDSWIGQNVGEGSLLIGINPGASWPTKLWPPDSFAEAGRILARQTGVRLVIVWGPGEERVAGQIAEEIGEAALLAPPTTLRELAYLLSRCDLLISSDTGPAHIAVAVKTPVVAVYGPSNPIRNGPFDERSIVVRADIDCLDCWKHKCNTVPLRCMDSVTAEMVAEAAQIILKR
jgi:lipopolysaccharide heptosyltransferase I